MKNQLMMNGADVQLARLTKMGDPLEKIKAAIDWELFRRPICKRIRKKNQPLTEEQKASNREKAKVCARVEHVLT